MPSERRRSRRAERCRRRASPHSPGPAGVLAQPAPARTRAGPVRTRRRRGGRRRRHRAGRRPAAGPGNGAGPLNLSPRPPPLKTGSPVSPRKPCSRLSPSAPSTQTIGFEWPSVVVTIGEPRPFERAAPGGGERRRRAGADLEDGQAACGCRRRAVRARSAWNATKAPSPSGRRPAAVRIGAGRDRLARRARRRCRRDCCGRAGRRCRPCRAPGSARCRRCRRHVERQSDWCRRDRRRSRRARASRTARNNPACRVGCGRGRAPRRNTASPSLHAARPWCCRWRQTASARRWRCRPAPRCRRSRARCSRRRRMRGSASRTPTTQP